MDQSEKFDLEWQQFFSSLEDSSNGFFLLLYDREFTCESLVRRLKKELDKKELNFTQVHPTARMVIFIKDKLKSEPVKAIAIKINESNSSEQIRALNLLRETLYNFRTNFIFLIQKSTYSFFAKSAHDLTTWFKVPYEFALPDFNLPEMPLPEKTLSESNKSLVIYYRERIQEYVEFGEKDKAFQLLSTLADLYLDTAMYEAASSIYRTLMEYYEISSAENEYLRFKGKFNFAEGWLILAKLNLGGINVADQNKLKRLINNDDFSVELEDSGVLVVDSVGHSKSFSIEFFIRLGLLSERVQEKLSEITKQTTDPRLLLLDAENAYKYSAARYGIGYDLMHVELKVKEDGSAQLKRTVYVEAYSQINILDTYLIKTEEENRTDQSGLKLKYIKSLDPNKIIKKEDAKIDDSSRRLSAIMTILPQLSYGESVTYEMLEVTTEGLYATSKSDLENREYPFDHFGWNISRPTRRLIFEVHFPENCMIQNYEAEVKIAAVGGYPSLQRQLAEQTRLSEIVVLERFDSHQVLKFHLSYPMTGLVYLLNWQLK